MPFFLMSFVFLTMGVASASCPTAPLTNRQMNEKDLRSFVESWNRKGAKIEDFACCIPNLAKENTMISHSSISAQNSRPDSPRVFMANFDRTRINTVPLNAIFTINGGHSNLQQTNSVEIALISDGGVVQLYDLEVHAGKAKLSKPNPESCNQCHGEFGQASKFGPKLIFDGASVWSRFVNGMSFRGNSGQKEALKYLENRDKITIDAVLKNRRFRCLDLSKIKNEDGEAKSVATVLSFDFKIHDLAAARAAKMAAASKDYEKYKYAISAVSVCESSRSEIDCQLAEYENRASGNISASTSATKDSCKNWFSPSAVREILTHPQNQETLSDEVKSTKDILDLEDRKVSEIRHEVNEQERRLGQINLKGDQAPHTFQFWTFPRVEMFFVENGPQGKLVSAPPLSSIRSGLLQKYALDSELRSRNAGGVSPIVRLLFEARGIPIMDWGTDMAGGYQRHVVEAAYLVDQEPKDSKLRQILEPLREYNRLVKFVGSAKNLPSDDAFWKKANAIRDEVCENLRMASLESTNASSNSGTRSEQTTTEK